MADGDVNVLVLPGTAGRVLACIDRADGCPLELLHADATKATTSTGNGQIVQFAEVLEVGRMPIQPNNHAAARRDSDIGALPPLEHQATAAYVETPTVT